MRSWLLVVFGVLFSALIISALVYTQRTPLSSVGTTATPSPSSSSVAVSNTASPSPAPSVASNPTPDLKTDSSGLSHATATLTTSQGVIKFKFYSDDAPKTVKRICELIGSGFYNGLSFHRVIPGFVAQGGDPTGTGTGGSGQKLDAEFNSRRHVEGALAMARAAEPNSADSQFYISLGIHPHLDRNYTVFGQVIEGMDVAKKLKVGDKMTSLTLQ